MGFVDGFQSSWPSPLSVVELGRPKDWGVIRHGLPPLVYALDFWGFVHWCCSNH